MQRPLPGHCRMGCGAALGEQHHEHCSLSLTVIASDVVQLGGAVEGVPAISRLELFLYLLLRDHLTAGEVEKLALQAEAADAPPTLTNYFLNGYAANLADRLKADFTPEGASIDPNPSEGLPVDRELRGPS